MTQKTATTKRDILRYVALPGIRPRFAELFGRGFQYIPYFIAIIFESVRLVPRNHPYLNVNNIGRYGVRHIIAEAANNLVLDRKNIDQILVFSLVLVAMVIVLVQIVLVFIALFMQPSFAGPAAFPTNFAQFFVPGGYPSTPPQSPPQDLALILLDMVFGVPEMFGSCVDQSVGVACESTSGQAILMSEDVRPFITNGGPNISDGWVTHWAQWPYPIHEGLHQLFAVYSYGLLIVAMLITCYFIFTVVAETAQTGTAFGKRFNKVWVPVRIVVAFGLLVPLTIGLNSGQYIVLYAAKFGTGFASNGWAYFNGSISTHYYENMGETVSVPNFPEFGGLAQFFMAAATCKSLYMLDKGYTEDHNDEFHIVPYLVKKQTEAVNHLPLSSPGATQIPAQSAIANTDSYNDIMQSAGFGYKSNRLVLRFGRRDENAYSDYLGYVKPICGEVVLELQDSRPPGEAAPGPEVIQRYYWWLVKAFWWSEGRLDATVGGGNQRHSEYFACDAVSGLNCGPLQIAPDDRFRERMLYFINAQFNQVLNGGGGPDHGGHGGAIAAQRASGRWDVPAELMEKGWAGAALWYNRIAEMNGAITSATFNIPMPSLYPAVMEFVRKQKEQHEQNFAQEERFNPVLSGNNTITWDAGSNEGEYAVAMNNAYKFWADANAGASTQVEPTGNVIIDTINFIFGTHGLFDMRKNADVNPLAQLVGLGRSLIETSIRNIGFAAIGATVGALKLPGLGALAGVVSGFFITAATISMTAGFILYYVIPFLPFIYFFFAVGTWIKSIFEAMVGVPLWALAHIRIDGDGLPGQAAINGYFLIFETFLRPILILFGFLASILIFSALVHTLNDVFNLVVANVGGFDMQEEMEDTAGTGIQYLHYYRSAVDEFFFTLVYVIVVYMLAQSSFKLIDQVPGKILRWMNQNVAPFDARNDGSPEALVSTSQIGAQQATNKLGGGLNKLASIVGS